MNRIEVSVCERVPAPPEQVFAVAVDPARFSELFPGFGPIPAVQRIERLDGGALACGSRRRVHSSDGSVLTEEVTALVAAERHRYRVSGFQAPFGWWVREAEGDWWFREVAGATEVRWDYRFEPSGTLARLPTALIVHGFFRPAMQRCLKRLQGLDWPREAAAAAPQTAA